MIIFVKDSLKLYSPIMIKITISCLLAKVREAKYDQISSAHRLFYASTLARVRPLQPPKAETRLNLDPNKTLLYIFIR